jgi:penicillin-binding protein 1A
MTALRQGVDPDSTTYTSMPLKFNDPKYGPIDVHTYSNSYIGRANLVRATLQSDNSIYQQLDLDVGPDNVKQTAVDMGIPASKLHGYPAEGLGGIRSGVSPLMMANAYATIASGGWRNRITSVRKVCFPKRNGGYDCHVQKPHRHKAFDDGVTSEVTRILKMNVQEGTGTKAQFGCPAAGKTGTVDDFTDAWFVGFTPHLATAVWVGHATERRTLGGGMAGGEVAAPIWGAYMKVAHGKYCGDFPAPKHPFQSQPFFGHYATTGVKDNKAGDYTTDKNGGSSLETGKTGADGKGTGNGSTKYPPDQYASPPQEAPQTQSPPATTTPQTPTQTPTPGATGTNGGTGTTAAGGTGAPPP